MRTELPHPRRGGNTAPPTVPFLIRHFAESKPSRLPSIRIPVTPANRALLRELRAAELAAWERVLPGALHERGAEGGNVR